MNSKQLSIVLGVIVVVLLAVVGYMALRDNSQTDTLSQQNTTPNSNLANTNANTAQPLNNTNTSTQQPANNSQPTSNSVKTYTNNRVGYQFEYPATGLQKGIDETIKYPSNQDPNRDLVQFVIGKNAYGVRTYVGVKHDTIEAWIKDELNGSAGSHNIADYTKRTIAGYTAYNVKGAAVSYVLYNDNVYEITGHSGVAPISSSDTQYTSLVSSFKFTK